MSKTIREIFGLPRISGEVGLEIEMEGRGLPVIRNGTWVAKLDGSLRGEGKEYVLAVPIVRDNVKTVLSRLWRRFETDEARLLPTNRCGVHVHLNVQHYTQQQVFTFMVMYLLLEDILVSHCGPGRAGNLFCLRARDAEWLCQALYEAVNKGRFRGIEAENVLRYASMNVDALHKYGSLEFRAMRTTTNYEDILTWVRRLLAVKDAAEQFERPSHIVEQVSAQGAHNFLTMIFGAEGADELMQGVADPDRMLFEGVRLVQDLAFAELPEPKQDDEEPEDLEELLRNA